MKIDYYQDKIVVYLINRKIKLEVKDIKKILFDVFNNLVNDYNIKMEDNYHINLYINYSYGIVLEFIKMVKDEYDDESINIELNILDDKLFLYEIDDPLGFTNNEIYYYDNKYYLNIKKLDITLLERAHIIYDDTVYKILGKGVKI